MPSLAVLALVLIGLYAFSRVRLVSSGEEGAQVSLLSEAAGALGGGEGFDAIYQERAAALGLDWRLVKAIAQHESGENPDAVNEADNESLGLMQVYCQPDGQGGCKNKLNIPDWPPAGGRDSLLEPTINVYFGAAILAANVQAYGLPKAIAVYNAWDQHTAPAGGPFKNQAYVDDVLRRAAQLGYQP